jgi:hypothetical protein
MSTLQQFLRGASKVTYSNATSGLTAVTVQAAIDEIDLSVDGVVTDAADLRTLSGTADGDTDLGTFTGATIADNVTVKAALQALETAHEETDANADDLVTLSGVAENSTDLGTFTGVTIPDSSTIKAALQSLETSHETTDGLADDLVTLSGVAANSTDLGTFTGATITDNVTVKTALQELETAHESLSSTLNTFEWQDSVLDADTLTPPVSPTTGDRYLINGVGTGAWAGQDNNIAEWDGSAWVFVAPTTGTFVSADDQADLLYYYGGASWSTKNFEATTASTGLTKVGFDIRLDASSAGAGLGFSAGVLNVNVDDATIEVATDTLQVKADGINDTHIDFGTGANQVSAVDIPIADTGALITATEVEGALAENRTAIDAIEDNTITSPNGSLSLAGTVGGDNQTADVVFSTTGEANRSIEAADLASTANGEGASMVGIEDSGALITATNVEGALAENRTAIDAIEDNTITSPNGSLSVAGTVGGDNQTVDVVFSTTGEANRSIEAADLASTANGEGASMVGVEDSAGNFTATNVEGVLTEIDGRLDTLEAAGTSNWTIQTTAYTAADGDKLLVDTTSAAVTITLPATPSAGDEVIIRDAKGTSETNAITVARNGSNIGGLAEDMTIQINNIQAHLVYVDAGHGWSVYAA